MAGLLADIPAFGLDVGGPTELIPPTIARLLGELAASPARKRTTLRSSA
jgi:hypothetical protein